MATLGDKAGLPYQARRIYTEELVKGLPALVSAVMHWANAPDRATSVEPAQLTRLRDAAADLKARGVAWHQGLVASLQTALQFGGATLTVSGALGGSGGGHAAASKLSLVDDATIEREITASRLALAITDRANWEFTDLRMRVALLERREELDANDLLRAHVLARLAVDAWTQAGLPETALRDLQPVLHEEFGLLVQEAYHEVNRWLVSQRVLPDVDLRPLIRRGRGNSMASGYAGQVGDETRLMTRTGAATAGAPSSAVSDNATALLERLNRAIERQVPAFTDTAQVGQRTVSPTLASAIGAAQQGVQRRLAAADEGGAPVVTVTPALLEELQARKQALKRAADSPVERATIEIVALLFQSILTEERIPAAVRVWFARLQMPVLRVAVGEPDFFATIDHPARRLIDRMGACVMGFDASARAVSTALEAEIKRIVQVVEAYPDTGRRVFQTVLTEFERFLENYFKSENEVTRKGVSLAQQVEQRETLAVQYTIELRKMLEKVPVQEGVRQFLFQVWADVMAVTAVRNGKQSDATKAMLAAAGDLVWSAGAKVSREERAEVIRKLPPLLKKLREGMESAGLPESVRDGHVQSLNESLAAAFSAKAAAIPAERFAELRERLEALEELLPDATDVQLDQTLMLDLSGDDRSVLEVVGEGGSMPTPAMLSWARELQVGSWYMLEYAAKTEPVQLAWQGMRRHLSLFVTPSGRCLLFEQNRLASYLQAGLLLPAQDEALTVRATRTALAKLDADPARLLN
ncbi:MAG TPA: DUF1631 family protein [Burkholderiaceae bacterium]|nr:DUF1631 family protein [Burkholderiaceae bacterium]